MTTWHVLAPEYPPGCGGVGDYTALLAGGLEAAGDRVRVWQPATLPDRFGPLTRKALDAATASDPGIVLVQYVPAAFGLRGLNFPFCRWIGRLRRRGVDVRVMFHEPFFYFGVARPWRNGLALGQRLMAAMLLRAASRVYYSTESWKALLAPYGAPADAEVLPIPATIPVDIGDRHRSVSSEGGIVVGHFGTYGEHVTDQLLPILVELARRVPSVRFRLVGRGAVPYVARMDPSLRARVETTAATDAADVAATLRSCDILVQPYPDGVTTRRTSMMGALTSGTPVVTSSGALTEAVWNDSGAVLLAPAGDAGAFADCVEALAADVNARHALGARGRRVYDEQFALPVTLQRLRRPA
jgi:glycosyltransferase involved in cell wall biosynthesis